MVILPVAVTVEVDDILCPLIFPYGAVVFPLYACKFPSAETLPIDDVILPKVDVISPNADSVPVKRIHYLLTAYRHCLVYHILQPMYLYLCSCTEIPLLHFIVPSTYKSVYADIPVGDVFIYAVSFIPFKLKLDRS